MKKFISILLVLSMVFSLMVVNVSALSLDSYVVKLIATPETGKSLTDIKAGDKITISVSINTNQDLNSQQIFIQYDTEYFTCPKPTENRGRITDYGGLSQSWYDAYMKLSGYAAFNVSSLYAFNDTNGKCGFLGYTTGSCEVLAADATENFVLFECILTAKKDVDKETVVSTTDANSVSVYLNGVTTQNWLSGEVTIGGSSATATPAPTPTATVAPTAAPEIANTTAANNNLTTSVVADKAFTAFAKITNVSMDNVGSFGIVVASGANPISAEDAKAGTAYEAQGALADGSYSVRLVNGEGEVDYFEDAYCGFIPFMVIDGTYYYGSFVTLK